jgi:hypothetical protein
MATILYKQKNDGTFESCMVAASRVKDLLSNGWDVVQNKTISEETDDTLSPKEVREAAKKAGIPEYKKARITTLKEKLGYEQSQD